MKSPRIALIHATTVAMQPVADAFRTHWPEAMITNLLDDSLSPDLKHDGQLTEAMITRFLELASYVFSIGSDALLFTCSAFGTAINHVKVAQSPKPVLKPNEAMFEEALEFGDKIGMLATFQPSIASMETEFYEMVDRKRRKAEITTIWVEGAMDALLQGNAQRHNDLIASAAPALCDCDAVMLAHFSTSQAKTDVANVLDFSVLTSPESAVNKLRLSLIV